MKSTAFILKGRPGKAEQAIAETRSIHGEKKKKEGYVYKTMLNLTFHIPAVYYINCDKLLLGRQRYAAMSDLTLSFLSFPFLFTLNLT